MSFSLLPTLITPRLTDLSSQQLRLRGIQLLMMDFDNTIIPYTANNPTEEMDRWLREMIASGIRLCVVSNSKKDRVKIFCRKYGIDCITHARKPSSKGLRQCMERYGLSPMHCAMVGDQIFTDTLAANRSGVTSILVKAIDNHNIWLKLRHAAEMPIIFLARKRRIQYDQH